MGYICYICDKEILPDEKFVRTDYEDGTTFHHEGCLDALRARCEAAEAEAADLRARLDAESAGWRHVTEELTTEGYVEIRGIGYMFGGNWISLEARQWRALTHATKETNL